MLSLVKFIIIFGGLLVPAIVAAYVAFLPMSRMRESFGNFSAFRDVDVPLGFFLTVKVIAALIGVLFVTACVSYVVQMF